MSVRQSILAFLLGSASGAAFALTFFTKDGAQAGLAIAAVVCLILFVMNVSIE